LQKELSIRLFSHYVYADYESFFDKNTAEIQRDIHVTPNNAISLYFMSIMHIGNQLFMMLFILGGLFFIDAISTAVITTLMIVLSFIYMLIANTVGKRTGEIARQSNKKILQWCSQCFGAIAEVKVNGKEGYFLGKFRRIYDYYTRAIRRKNVVNSLPKMILETVAVVGVCLVCLVNLQLGKNLADLIPVLGVYFFAFYKLLPAVTTIFGYMMSVKHAQPFVEAMFDNENMMLGNPRKQPRQEERLRVMKSIEFNDVVYSYPSVPDTNVLDNVSLEIPSNSFIGIVGRSGAGKSTLVAMLVGLLKPRKGSIKIDGKLLYSNDNMEKWQNNIGYIPQEIKLLDDTILTNVAYGEDNPDIEKVKKALDMAELTEFIESLPNGLHTRVGQNGAMLSGGQKQRIGIARALYREAEVLVLDEATSSLDNETAEQFTKNIISLKNQLTIISISHKIETLSACDQVYKMEGGRLTPISIA
jgi:ABC-type multidrug transport system fused ATPase/permease subunit